jgi:hypothetical protein
MGTNSAGRVGPSNEGQTDQGRGNTDSFTYNKGQRKTGKAGGSPRMVPNSDTVDGNKRTATDPRLA